MNANDIYSTRVRIRLDGESRLIAEKGAREAGVTFSEWVRILLATPAAPDERVMDVQARFHDRLEAYKHSREVGR